MTDPQWKRESQRIQQQCEIERMRSMVYGLTLGELEVLQLFVASRLRVVRGELDQVVDAAGLSSLARGEAERMNAAGLRHYRNGHPDFDAFSALASPADTARRNTDFQRFLGAVIDRAGNPPTKGTAP